MTPYRILVVVIFRFFSFEIEQTATGKSILEKGSSSLVFCAFVGRVAVGN